MEMNMKWKIKNIKWETIDCRKTFQYKYRLTFIHFGLIIRNFIAFDSDQDYN